MSDTDVRSTELTDEIDTEFLDDSSSVNETAPSQELVDSLDTQSEAESSDINLAKANEALTQFEQLQKDYEKKVLTLTVDAMFPSVELREEYLKNVASALYTEIHKQSKYYIRDWCKINNFTQSWSNPFLRNFSAKNVKYTDAFVPQAYSMRVKNMDTNEEQVLVEMQPTPRDATIQAAKKLGFDNSQNRLKAFAKFSRSAVEVILREPKYLREQQNLYLFDEHRRQIEARRYIPLLIRDKWMKEIQQALDRSNGII